MVFEIILILGSMSKFPQESPKTVEVNFVILEFKLLISLDLRRNITFSAPDFMTQTVEILG